MNTEPKKKLSAKNIILAVILFIIAALAFWYGSVILAVNSGTKFFMVWFALGIIFLVLGIITLSGKWNQVHKAIKILIALFFVCSGILIAVTWSLIIPHFNDSGEKNADAVIVLGAQVKKNGPSTVLRYRLDAAIVYLNENPDAVCIVSGYQGKKEPYTEAKGMKDYLKKQGIPESRIIMDDKSENSSQNLEYSKKLLPKDNAKVVLVTSNTHMYRALRIAKKNGYENISGLSAHTPKLFLLNGMLYESLSIVKNTVLGRM